MQLHFLLISALTRPFRGGARVELIRSSVVRPSVRPFGLSFSRWRGEFIQRTREQARLSLSDHHAAVRAAAADQVVLHGPSITETLC